MGNPLRDIRPAVELAAIEQVVEIADKISSFERLAGIIEADLAALEPRKEPSGWRDNAVRGELRFGFLDAKRRIPMVKGSVTAEVAARCQRCLAPFQLKLEIAPKFLLLESEQSIDDDEGLEVWELAGQTVRPQDIVEELLIMAMPFAATHDRIADCKMFAAAHDGAEELVTPFAALRSQMTQDESDPDE